MNGEERKVRFTTKDKEVIEKVTNIKEEIDTLLAKLDNCYSTAQDEIKEKLLERYIQKGMLLSNLEGGEELALEDFTNGLNLYSEEYPYSDDIAISIGLARFYRAKYFFTTDKLDLVKRDLELAATLFQKVILNDTLNKMIPIQNAFCETLKYLALFYLVREKNYLVAIEIFNDSLSGFKNLLFNAISHLDKPDFHNLIENWVHSINSIYLNIAAAYHSIGNTEMVEESIDHINESFIEDN